MVIIAILILAFYAGIIFYKGPDVIDWLIDAVAQITVKVERKTKRALRRWREIFGR